MPHCQFYRQLPFEELETRKFSVYVIDYGWTFLFANTHAITKLNGTSPAGKHIRKVWEENPALNFQPVFNMLKSHVEGKQAFRLQSRSPVTNKAIEIVGHPLEDAYYFSVYELPDKESLLSELKVLLRKKL